MLDEIAKKKILIVDDSPEVLVILRVALEKLGFEVIEATNGFEALAMVKKHVPALVIMDRMMPKMDGLKACALIKSDRRFCKIPVIMLTASAENLDRTLSEEAGADDFLNKPLNSADLMKRVQELVVRVQ
ncbi:MAG: response regulator [Candidatus Omnitrophica bacterium]|nr:response regulator [Candidatus Omnitrophota bacterium]